MAEHVGSTAGQLTAAASQYEPPRRFHGFRVVVAICAVVFVALGAIAGWLGYQILHDQRTHSQQDALLEAARQGALDLTTIDHTTVDADIKRILEMSTGTFHDDFERRSEPFAEVVKQAQSTSEGTITSAALESSGGDSAQILVLVSVKMSSASAAEHAPQVWRMRITVQQTSDAAKVSDVAFVS